MQTAILEKIREADNLPSRPAVAVEVLRLANQEDTSVQALAAVIQKDPALTAKILKVVNSSLFGIPHKIGSLTQAIGLLGQLRVNTAVLCFSLVETVRGVEGEGLDFEAYWRRSISSAVAASLISKAVAPDVAEEAYITGLLCDLGIVAAWLCAPDLYQPILDSAASTKRPLVEIEARCWGFTHARISRELLEGWDLPPTLCEAVGAHHGEGLATLPDGSAQFAQIVRSATTVADFFSRDIPAEEIDSVKAHCLNETAIDQASLEAMLESFEQHVRESGSALGVPIGETIDYIQLQTEAGTQMGRLSS